jgi:hypothetical protein
MQKILFRHRVEVAARYAWFKVKYLLGQNIGVDKNFLAGHAAVRLSKGRLPQGIRITCAGRRDGVGMQAMARISGMNFAKAFGATYVDSPFPRLDHAPDGQQDWCSAWESCLNLGKGEAGRDDGNYVVVDYSDYLLKKRPIDERTVLRFQQCYWLNRHYPDSLDAISDSLRSKFRLPPTSRDRDQMVVAVHVRRGDVGNALNSLRFTPNDAIVRTIESLRGIIEKAGAKATFEVHSQGHASDFREFSEIGCELHLDSDAIWTMEKLVASDVLIMSKSSFSYVAALINRGVKFYEPTFNPPLSSWIVRQNDGTFDESHALDRITEHLRAESRIAAQSSATIAPALI